MKNKTWGGRFKKTLDPRAAKFNASLGFDHVLFEKDIIGSQAHAMMLGRQGIIPLDESQAIHPNSLFRHSSPISSKLAF